MGLQTRGDPSLAAILVAAVVLGTAETLVDTGSRHTDESPRSAIMPLHDVHADSALAGTLHSEAPDAGHAMMLFGRFVGAWDLRWTGVDRSGSPSEAPGELTFGWVLGGRAIQDVWMVPAGQHDGGNIRAFHGTTVRFHDPAIAAWRSTWIDPVIGRVRKFIGRADGDDIALVSLDGDPLLRWRFTDIRSDSFTWLGEYSTDEGRTWHLEERMVARRRRHEP